MSGRGPPLKLGEAPQAPRARLHRGGGGEALRRKGEGGEGHPGPGVVRRRGGRGGARSLHRDLLRRLHQGPAVRKVPVADHAEGDAG
eukprot:13339306-Alexandrium_andersonii.AAC.1